MRAPPPALRGAGVFWPEIVADFAEYWYNGQAAPPQTGNRKGVTSWRIINLLVSVVANVAAYCVCKWLDRHK